MPTKPRAPKGRAPARAAKHAPPIAHSRPTLAAADARAVAAVLRGGHIGRGAESRRFGIELARRLGQKWCIPTATGSAALHLALLALKVGANSRDEVIVPSYACTALLNAVHYAGATPVVVDVEPGSWNISAAEVARGLSRRTRAVIAPHAFGAPADIHAITRLGVPVIEDCAQALGATIGGKRVGAAGRLTVCSFYATKCMATGHGGALATSHKALRDAVLDLLDFDNRENYMVRYNLGMPDVLAALGRAQLARLNEFIDRRQKIATLYVRLLRGLPVGFQETAGGCTHSYFRFLIAVPAARRGALEKFLAKRGIEAKRPVFKPLHRYLNLPASRFPGSELAHTRLISLPCYPSLRIADARRVARAVREFFG